MRTSLLVLCVLVLLGGSWVAAETAAPVKMDFSGEMELIFYRNSGGGLVVVDSAKTSGVLCSIEASGTRGVVDWNRSWSGKTVQGHAFSVSMNGPFKTAIDEKRGDLTGMDFSGAITLDGEKSSFQFTMGTGTVGGAPTLLQGSPLTDNAGVKGMALVGMSSIPLSEAVIGKKGGFGGGVDDKKPPTDTVVTFHFVSNVPGRK